MSTLGYWREPLAIPAGVSLTWQALGPLGLQVWIGTLAGKPVARISRQPGHGKACSVAVAGWMCTDHLPGSGAAQLGVKESPVRGVGSVKALALALLHRREGQEHTMIEFLLGYLLGSGRGRASGPAPKLSFGDIALVTRIIFTLACAGFMILILAPLFTDTMPEVLVPSWSWKLRALAASAVLVVNAAVNIATRAASEQ